MKIKIVSSRDRSNPKTKAKVKTLKTGNSIKQGVNFNAPENYEIYMRPQIKGTSIIQELSKDSFQKQQAPAEKKKESSPAKDKDENEEYKLPEGVSEEIDAIIDTAVDEKDPKKRAKIKKIAKKVATVAYSLILIGGSIFGTSTIREKMGEVPSSTVVSFDSTNEQLKNLADAYDIDPDIIKYVNNIDEESDLEEKTEITIPSTYDYLDDEIEELTTKLYKNNLNNKEINEIGEKIDAYKNKMKVQKEIADTYTDGDYVYIHLKEFNEENKLSSKYKVGTYSDDFISDLFDIKAKELHKNNSLKMGADEKGNETFVVSPGTTIRIPKNAIDTEDVSYEAFKDKKS